MDDNQPTFIETDNRQRPCEPIASALAIALRQKRKCCLQAKAAARHLSPTTACAAAARRGATGTAISSPDARRGAVGGGGVRGAAVGGPLRSVVDDQYKPARAR